MKEIPVNTGLIAYCGLYCGACPRYLKEKCPGCHENTKATWCKIRTCNIEADLKTCAECTAVTNVASCHKYNNFMAKIFEFIFRSNRKACIHYIRENGLETFAHHMAEQKQVTMKREHLQ